MSKYLKIKKELYLLACQAIEERLMRNKLTLQELKESAGSETKSSAGDKHETGRAMLHLEQEKAVKQLANNQSLKNTLDKIDPTLINSTVSIGSLVVTKKLSFFISIPLGKIALGTCEYFSISLTAPLAKKFIGKQKGDKVLFNGQEYLIEELC